MGEAGSLPARRAGEQTARTMAASVMFDGLTKRYGSICAVDGLTATGALQLGPLATTRGALLSGWAGSLVLIAYAATLAVLAARRLTRHDLPLIT